MHTVYLSSSTMAKKSSRRQPNETHVSDFFLEEDGQLYRGYMHTEYLFLFALITIFTGHLYEHMPFFFKYSCMNLGA